MKRIWKTHTFFFFCFWLVWLVKNNLHCKCSCFCTEFMLLATLEFFAHLHILRLRWILPTLCLPALSCWIIHCLMQEFPGAVRSESSWSWGKWWSPEVPTFCLYWSSCPALILCPAREAALPYILHEHKQLDKAPCWLPCSTPMPLQWETIS